VSAIIPVERIERRIFLLRRQRVMLSTDLAELYEVEQRALIQAVKRNIERFPADFMFQLTWDEIDLLRSQSVTLDIDDGPRSRSQFVILNKGRPGSRSQSVTLRRGSNVKQCGKQCGACHSTGTQLTICSPLTTRHVIPVRRVPCPGAGRGAASKEARCLARMA